MKLLRSTRLLAPALLILAAGQAVSVYAQSAPPAPAQPQPITPPAAAPSTPPKPEAAAPAAAKREADTRISFNFKNAPFDQVLDFFSRQTGLPVIREAEPPASNVTFISPEKYSRDAAFDILNRLLYPHGLQMRPQAGFWLLSRLEEMRSLGPVVTAKVPDSVGDTTVVTVVVPLNNAQATLIADSIKPLVSKYGSVTTLGPQNALVLVDTAAQCRRLGEVIRQLDSEPPSDARFQLFPLKHAEAAGIISSLKGLMTEKRVLQVMDKDGNVRTREENRMDGLTLQADERTNAVIAVGTDSKLQAVGELIEMLDRPAGEQAGTRLVSFNLPRVGAAEAASQVTALFAGERKAERPTILPIANQGRLVVVGNPDDIDRAKQLLEQIDPGASPATDNAPGVPVIAAADAIPLKHAAPNAVAALLGKLLSPRQQGLLRYAPGPDGHSLIVSGPPEEIASLRKLIEGFDLAPTGDAAVRQVRIVRGDVKSIVGRATELFNATEKHRELGVKATADERSRTVTLIGPERGLDDFAELLRTVESNTLIDRELRTFTLERAVPSAAAARLTGMVSALLRPADGSAFEAPEIQPIDELKTLVVRALPSQLPAIEQLVKRVDRVEADAMIVRVVTLRSGDPKELAARAADLFKVKSAAGPLELPQVTPDASTRTMLLVGDAPSVAAYVQIVDELQKQVQPAREVRNVPLRFAKADEVVGVLKRVQSQWATLSGQPGPAPLFEPMADTNSVMIAGDAAQVAAMLPFVQELDQQAISRDTAFHRFPLVHLDPGAAAAFVRDFAAATNLQGAVRVTIEPGQRAVVVTAPAATLKDVQRLIEQLDAPAERPKLALKLYSLKSAQADRVSPLLRSLLEGRLRDLIEQSGLSVPDSTRLVEVIPDAASNTVIVSAPPELQQQAEELLARLDAPPANADHAAVRVVPLTEGDAAAAADALRQSLATMTMPSGGKVNVSASPAANAVIIAGAEQDLDRVEAVVHSLDVPVRGKESIDVVSVNLKSARAELVAPVLQTLLVKEEEPVPYWARRETESERAPVRVAAEARTNSIVVTGPSRVVEVAKRIIAQLDVSPGADPCTQRPIRVLSLQNAAAGDIAPTVREMFKSEPDPSLAPVVEVNEQSNSLIVRADPARLDQIEKLVGTLDRATVSAGRELRTIPIDRSRADAEVIARSLQRLLEQRTGTRVRIIRAEDLLKPEPNAEPAKEDKPKQGALAPALPGLSAPALLIATMAIAVEPDSPQPGAKAAPTADSAAPSPSGEPDTVTIAVDPVTNSLIISGSTWATQRAQELAAELQRQLPAEPLEVTVVQLPDAAEAWTVSQVVSTAIGQIGRAGADNPGGFTGRCSVQPDPTGSALIVSANATDLKTITQIISAVATPHPGSDLTVKAYPLANTSAPRLLRAVLDLFSSAPRGRQAQRVLRLAVPGPGGAPASAKIDPGSIRAAIGPGGSSLVIAAPADAIPMLDQFIALMDQSPTAEQSSIRQYTLAHARAEDAAGTLQRAFAAAHAAGGEESPRATFIADPRTNSLLVTASEPQHEQTRLLLASIDASSGDQDATVAILPVASARPSVVRSVVENLLVGRDPARRDAVRLTASDETGVLIVQAPAADVERARKVVEELDRADTALSPIRTLKLERANADAVAASLQKFFDERARTSSRSGRPATRNVAIIGDDRTGSLVVSAPDADYEQIKSLVATLDAPAATADVQFRVIPLEHARVSDIRGAVEAMVRQAQSIGLGSMFRGGGARRDRADGDVVVEFDERSASVVVIGREDAFPPVERIIRALDTPATARSEVAVRAFRLKGLSPRTVGQTLRQALTTPADRRGPGARADDLDFEVDPASNALVLVGPTALLDQAGVLIDKLQTTAGAESAKVESIPLKFTQAESIARSIDRFFQQRLKADAGARAVSIVGANEGNVLIAAGAEEDLALVRGFVAKMDQPGDQQGRTRELYKLRNAVAADLAGTVRDQFPRLPGGRESQVVVTPDRQTNTLIVSSPAELSESIAALIQQLDAPPAAADTTITTVTLSSARAEDVATALRSALPASVKVTITPVRRSNSLLLGGSPEAIKLVVAQINDLDKQPVRSQAEIRRVRVKNADLYETASTLRTVIETWQTDPNEPEPTVSTLSSDNSLLISARADRLEEIARIVDQLDVAGENHRTTEFVPLKFADAQATADALRVFYGRYAPEPPTPGARAVTIIANPASKSLVVAADAAEWPGIRSLIEKLDSDKYDTSRRLEIVALKNADAVSLARTLTEAFASPLRAEIERQRAQQQQEFLRRQGRNGGREDFFPIPTVLVGADTAISVTAEPLTNSLVIGGPRDQTDRIKAVVAQLDTPEFARMPEIRMVPVRVGVASQLAATLRPLFVDPAAAAGAGSRSLMIVGEDRGNVLMVRADEAQFAQIKAMAESLQQEGDRSQLSVHVLRLRHMPAGRVLPSLKSTFTPVAKQNGEPLAIELDRTGNGLVIAASARLFDQIKSVAEELDGQPAKGEPGAPGEGPAPLPMGLNQGISLIDLQNHTPARMVELLTQLGVTREQDPERPGLVAEPVTLAAMTTRRAVAVSGAAGDIAVVGQLVKSLDAAPIESEQHVAVIGLKKARAEAIAKTIEGMLNPKDQQSKVDLAASLAEQVRRLSIHRADGKDDAGVGVDLTKPIVVRPEPQSNALIIASTEANVKAIRQLVEMLDKLPIGEQVVVRFFPLKNASAERIAGVVRDLFAQGERLRQQPDTGVKTEPESEVGKALTGQVYVSVDERTNALVAAGPEAAVALVEVLIKQLDNERTAQWIEPTLIRLRHADAVRLAETLRHVLLEGQATTPESEAIQRQIARLRIVEEGADPNDPSKLFQADRFAPMSSLVIVPESTLNALIVVGTRANAAAVAALARMLDVPAAAASNTVRIFPLQVAAAERVGGMLTEVFKGQIAAGTLRPEDNLVVVPDARTNSLVISTSPRSFRMVEELIGQLDAKSAVPLFGVTVIPVPSGDVRELAPRLERLLQERISASRRAGEQSVPSDKVSIQPDPATNSLLVAASPENVETIRQLLDVLTKGAEALAASQTIDVINVTSARAEDLAGAIRDLYVEKEQRLRGQDAVRVTGDARLNALIVRGTADDVRAIRALVERLDGAQVATVTEIRRIELKQADAADVVKLLQNVLAGRPIAGAGVVGQRKSQVLRFIREQTARSLKDKGEADGTPTEAAISGAVQEQVTLTAELRTNSLVVVAPSRLMVLIEALVADLDTTTAGGRNVRVFRLKNADARAMADVLRDLFNLRQQGSQLVLVPGRSDDQPTEGGKEKPAPELYPTLDERQQLAITIDARTNSLLVSATPEYLDRVEKVITELDNVEAQEREQVVFELRNAKAPAIAQTLRSYFTEQSERARQILGTDRAGSLLRILEHEITVQGDAGSNRLLVGVSPKYKEMVSKLVQELDSTPPQVMIQVLLAEVTIDADKSWGLEFKVGPFGGEAYKIGGTATSAGVATSLGVPNLSVSSTDFDLLIRALEAQGRLEVLSRPEILVNNNEKARIQVGENVALVESVQRYDTGNTVADVTREDVGIILSVTPNISADGFVRMDILPEISKVSARTTQITEDFQAPIITKRQVETNVTVKDGETIVIGGLLQTSEEERTSKIPLLGDIPLAGNLFRSTTYTNSKTELLVLLTPRVIRSDGQSSAALTDLSDKELERLSKPELLRPFLDGSRIPDPAEDEGKPTPPRSPGKYEPVPVVPPEPQPPSSDEPTLTPPRSESHSAASPRPTRRDNS